jgi:hypothetical protein
MPLFLPEGIHDGNERYRIADFKLSLFLSQQFMFVEEEFLCG